MRRIAIVRVDYMAGRTARRTKVTRMIIGAKKIQRRIHQPGFLQSEKNGISAIVAAKAARA